MTKIEFGLLDDESATKAIETVSEIAGQHKIDWALAGGLAVILYGSDRLTKDVDIIATRILPLESEGTLIQGGERYRIAAKNQPSRLTGSCGKMKQRSFIKTLSKMP